MKNTAKRTLLCILAALMLLPLSACHGSRGLDAFAVPDELDMSRDYEISFWAKNDTNKAQVAVYEKAIADFQALYPNIKVNLRLYTDYNRIYNDVITNIATQTTPNVCISYPDHIATYLTGTNVVVPLSAPGVVTTGILTFVGSWNSYMLPLFILTDHAKYTLPLGVQAFASEHSVNTAQVLAFTSLSMIPALVVFSLFERRIVGGLTGAVKG